MKLKSFSLMEVLISSLIFMSVVVVSVSSFAMVRNSNNKVEDTTITNQCARQLEDVISAQVKSSNFGKRVMGVLYQGGRYVFKEITSDASIDEYDGIALFTKAGKYYSVIYKDGDTYYQNNVSYPGNDPTTDSPIKTLGSVPMSSNDCVAFIIIGNGVFNITATKTAIGDSQSNDVYSVVVEDKLYRKGLDTERSAEDRNSFSRMYLDATNSKSSI